MTEETANPRVDYEEARVFYHKRAAEMFARVVPIAAPDEVVTAYGDVLCSLSPLIPHVRSKPDAANAWGQVAIHLTYLLLKERGQDDGVKWLDEDHTTKIRPS